MDRIRIFKDGDKVRLIRMQHKMIVMGAQELLKGFKYKLAFQKKDGTADKEDCVVGFLSKIYNMIFNY